MKVLVAEDAGVPAFVGRVAGRVEGNCTRGTQTGAKIENVRARSLSENLPLKFISACYCLT